MLPEEIEEKVLALLRNHGHRAFRPKEIAKRLGLHDRQDYLTFREVLHRLVTDERIAQIKGGRYTLKRSPKQATGVLSVSPRGFGIVTLDDDQTEVYVGPFDMWTALPGDHVQVTLHRPSSGNKRREAVVDRVVERRHTDTVGTIELYGDFGMVSSDDTRFLYNIRVPSAALGGARSGDKVHVRIDRFEDPDDHPEGTVIRVLGNTSEPGVAEKALALSLNIPIDFPVEVLEEAAAISMGINETETQRREDFRGRAVFTIDPEDARDFDDAIHVADLGDGTWEVGVHIADVSHYVHADGPVDKEALRRGTSVYLVEHVFPMLPEHLSNEICTLRAGEDRLTMSCVIRLDNTGKVIENRIVNSLIRSVARLTYEEAEELIAGVATGHDLIDDIRLAARIAGTLTSRRFSEGSVDFETAEPRIILDDRGWPIDITSRTRLQAHRLIEEFMLLANRLVAEYLKGNEEKNGATIYRVHANPDRDRIADLALYVGAFGLDLPHKKGVVDAVALNRLLRDTRGTPKGPVVSMAALRSMAKARYSVDNCGHFGLGFEHYTHFTSPIRRYPDLTVHRLLKRSLEGSPPMDNKEHLKAICDIASERERMAEEAEREAIKLKQVQFMQDHIGEQHAGIVTGATSFGVFVQIEAWLVEGLVHVRDMDDYYEYDERQYALVGSRGKKIRIGDTVEVVITDADVATRQIDFMFAPGQGL